MIARISKGQLLRWGALSVVLLSVVVVPAAGGAAPPPNIVVFMTDDEPAFDGRFTDWMPNRKALFQTQGVTFTDFHSSTPLCCPSRASFLTGQYTHNHGVYANKAALFNPSMSLATQLLGVGYQNFLVGKYMNGYGQCNKIICAPHVPPGWTRFAAFGNPAYYNYDFWVDGVRRSYGSAPSDYSTDVIRDTTLSFMRGANPSKPMFLWIATNGPYSPATPAPRHAGVNCNPARWTPPSWNEADVSDKPAYVRGQPLMKKAGSNSVTCRPLLAVDELIGAVRDELSSEGRLANTLFVYGGDNGMSRGEHRLSGKNAPYVTNVPFAMSWTGHIAAGTKISTRLENIDFAHGLRDRRVHARAVSERTDPTGRAQLRAASAPELAVHAGRHARRADDRERRRAELGIGDHDDVFVAGALAVHRVSDRRARALRPLQRACAGPGSLALRAIPATSRTWRANRRTPPWSRVSDSASPS